MRQARITDDAIARLIYVTEYLWGQDCLLNLYIVVTFASKYLVRPDDARGWIERQAEMNWRFKHIYNLVDNNPCRFIFVDNPDSESQEPNVEERQGASREAVMRVLLAHPRNVVPPFTHALMKCVQKKAEPQLRELETREREVQALVRENSESTTNPDFGSDGGSNPPEKATPRRRRPQAVAAEQAKLDVARKRRADAKAKRLEAEQALQEKLQEVKEDAEFKQKAVNQADQATLKFARKYEAQDETSPTSAISPRSPGIMAAAAAAGTTPVVACRRMLTSLSKTMRRKPSEESGAKDRSGSAKRTSPLPVEDESSQQATEQRLDLITAGFRMRLQGDLEETFQRLARQTGSTKASSTRPAWVSPMIFQRFLNEMDPNINRHQAGAIWRRGDANCDGQMDLIEFRALFGVQLKPNNA